MTDIKIKICGINHLEAAKAALDSGAAYLGFVFFSKSPRNLINEKATQFKKINSATKVAVTVNPTDPEISGIINSLSPNYIQLHGNEPPERAESIKSTFNIKIIKAFSVSEPQDLQKITPYLGIADMLLFDARPCGDLPGGTGHTFDWNILRNFSCPLPWFLSGGLNASNIAEAIRITGAKYVDASSSLESSPGVKDAAKIEQFCEAIRKINC